VTIHQNRLDTMLGNSSVMHMGYIFLGIAAGSPVALNGAVLLMFAHGISIALAFALCGKMRNQLGTLEFSKLGGSGGERAVPDRDVRLCHLLFHRPAGPGQLRG